MEASCSIALDGEQTVSRRGFKFEFDTSLAATRVEPNYKKADEAKSFLASLIAAFLPR